jgi:hypothetical protein
MILSINNNYNRNSINSLKNHILKSIVMKIDIFTKFINEQDFSENLMFVMEKFIYKTKKLYVKIIFSNLYERFYFDF